MSGPEPFHFTDQQQERILAAHVAWEEDEGEERLERLRQREEDAETLRRIQLLLTAADFQRTGELDRPQVIHLLSLFRVLAPNPNLDARLLTRTGEPQGFNFDLHDLLYGRASIPIRLRQFMSRRSAGAQSVLQLLCGVYPDKWPLVTRAGIKWLEIAPEQRTVALITARERFHLHADLPNATVSGPQQINLRPPGTDPVLSLLADVVIYTSLQALTQATDFVMVHRLLTAAITGSAQRRRAMPPLRWRQTATPEFHAFGLSPGSTGERSLAGRVSETNPPDYDAVPTPDLDNYRTADVMTLLEAEVAAQGFTYPSLTLRDYYLCLQTKPYVWLLGANGIGKTRLSALFASALTGNGPDQYRLIPVRPDWGDSAPLLGYVNLLADRGNGRYVMTSFLEFLLRAAAPTNSAHAYFLCLDEMNLARVEHYFAEVLSAMETASQELLLPNGYGLTLPSNLFITGTLNTDDATHPLSRKVVDRANTISLRAVSLKGTPPSTPTKLPAIPPSVRQALFLRRRVTTASAARIRLDAIGNKDLADLVVDTLIEVNDLLEPYDLQFAYRLRDEALCYCANSFDIDGGGLLMPEDPRDPYANAMRSLDFQILQKVLPRLGGTQDQLELLLSDLMHWADTKRFMRTAQKLRVLLIRLRRDGFVSFD